MAYYYVKDDGTAESGTATGDGGRYASAKTGDWSTAFSATTEYYASLYAASTATTPPTAGDFIFISNLHSKSYAPGNNVTIISSASGDNGIGIISVDDTAVEDYSPGAYENATGGSRNYILYRSVHLYGVDLEADKTVTQFVTDGSEISLQDCTITTHTTTSTYAFYMNIGGMTLTLTNVDIVGGAAAAVPLYVSHGGRLIWNGGTLSVCTDLIKANFGLDRGGYVEINGVDLSSVSGTIMPAVTAVNSDNAFVKLTNCQLNSGVTLHGSLTKRTHRFEMYNCDDSSGNDFYRFYIADGTGTAENNEATYVTATESWYEGTDKSSIAVTTTSLCSIRNPFIFELPAQYVDLSNTSSDVVTIDLITTHATSAIDLTDTDIAAFLCYPDGTTAVTPRWVTSSDSTVGAGNYGIDPLAAGTALPTSGLGAGDWTGELADTNYYQLHLDTSGTPGQATIVKVRIEVYKPSITAGQLFINSEISVS